MKNWALYRKAVLISTLLFLSGCGTFGIAQRSNSDEARIRNLEREVRRKQSIIEELKERNLVLEKKYSSGQRVDVARAQQISPQLAPAHLAAQLRVNQSEQIRPSSNQIVAPNAAAGTALPAAQIKQSLPTVLPEKKTAPIEAREEQDSPAPESVTQTGEQKLYSKVLETYRMHKSVEMQKVIQILIKTYPDSVYADNALYLAGLLAYEENNDLRAGQFMDRVLREYPRGNKAVSALFAQAMIEKRLGHLERAKEKLKSVKILYPGSPEAARCQVELKFIELANGQAKHREG